MKCIICAIAKQENAYLYEWAKYHLDMGFSSIHLYDNNDVDGEKVLDVFAGTEVEGRVTVHDVRGMKYMQKVVYQECYDKEEFDWCAFIDIDEFITFTLASGYKTIESFLKDKDGWEAVHLNWMCYGDGDTVSNDGRLVLERFKNPIMPVGFYYSYMDWPENSHVKSIIRKGVSIDWCGDEVANKSNPHTPAGLKRVCNSLGQQVQNEPFSDVFHEKAFVRHFMTKTIEEYAVKVARQCADCEAVLYTFPKFFRVNRITFSKLSWLKMHFPQIKVLDCIKERWKYLILDYRLPFRFVFRSLRNCK